MMTPVPRFANVFQSLQQKNKLIADIPEVAQSWLAFNWIYRTLPLAALQSNFNAYSTRDLSELDP
jgi:hypothetical protein